MNKLRAIQLFVRVSELGSFTKAAEEFALAKSIVSKEISRLEESLDAKLLYRSTRTLSLTPLGEGYLRYCHEALAKLEEAENYVSRSHCSPSGKLKINAPMAMGLTTFDVIVANFMERYPNVELEIYLSDDSLDLMQMGFDLALRMASREFDSPYVGVPLANFPYVVCVGKNYFDDHPAIECADDLKQHNCFEYSYFRNKNSWPIGDGVRIAGNLKVNSTLFMKTAINNGQGVAFLPDFVCAKELDKGEFIEILADLPRPTLSFYALYPDRNFVSPQLRAFIDFLREWFNKPL
ncbi:LysR family transcriptional regulator [Sinobacterium caligoides]|uniref:LysR family transcriptional regulator n=1 Tax=Sinobacterium caligoides TaxID=933926 RepID=A0A3N2DE11_9GAMM|nr:LysR family transcriptional regulator [Sinobacterium caligoides]ROR97898.1 LysR family transcriptional regulator [Sinobacterium caligoides]